MGETVVVPDRHHPEVGWLWNFVCDPKFRPQLANPWTIERDGQPWTVASNGHVLAMTPRVFGFEDGGLKAPNFESVFKTFPKQEPVAFPLREARAAFGEYVPPAETLPCDACDSTGEVDCEECDGEGEVDCECSCGHQHGSECDDCGGRGTTPCDCAWAKAQAKPTELVRVGDGYFSLEYLRRILMHLPDAPALWQQEPPLGIAVLSMGEWTVAIMPMRYDGGDKVRYTFTPEARP